MCLRLPSTSSNVGTNTAVVTGGDQRHEFEMSADITNQCVTLFGLVGGAGTASDGSDVSIDIGILPVGYESGPRCADLDPPLTRVTGDANNKDRRAGIDDSQVDSYTNDGETASGTASFIDMNVFFTSMSGQADCPTPVYGTFEISRT